MMTTIRDVAKEAEVSVATVSRVLNNNGYVNEDTRKKVLKVIEKLNYKPNAVARSLFKKQSKTIGLIVPDIKNPFFPEIARAVEDVMNLHGFTLILCNSDEYGEKEKKYLEILKQKYIDGIIIVTSKLTSKDLKEAGIPIVALDRVPKDEIPSVSVDHYDGARKAVQYLKSIGCKKIAHIRGPKDIISSEERYRGYLDEVKSEAWFQEDLVVNGDYNVNASATVTELLLQRHPDIDGIFAGNDQMAVGVLKAANQLQKVIPDDLSLIGFDGIELGRLIIPELTTISQPIYELGSTAAKMLLDLINGKTLEKMHVTYEASLVIGKSTRIFEGETI